MSTSSFVHTLDLFMNKFAEFNLDKHTKNVLRDLYRILYYRADSSLSAELFPVGILLETEFPEYGKSFVKKLYEELKSADLIKGEIQTDPEKNRSVPKNSTGLFVLEDCQSVGPDDSNYTYHINAYTTLWNYLTSHPAIISIAIVSSKVVEKCWKKNNLKYYQMFRHHIVLKDEFPEQILKQVLQSLSGQFHMTADFKKYLARYIDIVYPKADLKTDAFCEDLKNRILTSYYTGNTLRTDKYGHPQLQKRHVPYVRLPKSFDNVISCLGDMIGTESIIEQFQSLYYTYRYQPFGTKLRMNMAFTGSPGTGKTTVAGYMAEMLYAMGALKTPKLTVVKHEDMVSEYVGQTPKKAGHVIESALDGVLFLDEAYAFANTRPTLSGQQSPEQQALTVLLQAMEQYHDRLIVIFAGYKSAIDQLMDTNEGFRSRITHFIHFPDFTDDQLVKIFLHFCEKNHMQLENDRVKKLLEQKISTAKSMKDFGNARTIENIFNEIFAAANKREPGTTVITKVDISCFIPKEEFSSLEQLSGFDDIKDRIKEYEMRSLYLHELKKRGIYIKETGKHMLFIGNPGTGKTTVAKVLANDLYRAGVLATNRCFVVGANDLAAAVGSGKLLKEYMIEARGGVLLIDEAYALCNTVGAQELIPTILTEMEDHPETIMIFAGYPHEMYQFINQNPGLASRIDNNFFFPDFSVEDLTDMFLHILEGYQFTVEKEAVKAARKVIDFFSSSDNFGNGRFVRKLTDKTIEKRACDPYDEHTLLTIQACHVPSINEMKESVAYGNYMVDPDEIPKEHKIRTSVHEMGHALLHMLLLPKVPIEKVTIEAGAGHYGYMQHGVPETRTNDFYQAQISVCLGGRNAELLIFKNHSDGCSADYETAIAISQEMVNLAMNVPVGSGDYQSLLARGDQIATQLLKQNRKKLLYLASSLYKAKTLSGEELKKISDYYDNKVK